MNVSVIKKKKNKITLPPEEISTPILKQNMKVIKEERLVVQLKCFDPLNTIKKLNKNISHVTYFRGYET